MSATASVDRPTSDSGRGPDVIRVLLVEDDPGDALLVEEYLADVPLPTAVTRARTLAEATAALTGEVECVLLDLALPDADGLDGLRHVLRVAPQVAVIVLTGLTDEYRGIAAVAAGAQDYLLKGQVDGPLLARAIRFAIERRRAEDTVRQLREAELLARENARLERGLLPTPLVDAPDLDLRTAYRPGRRQALLGGDFYDVVEASDGSVYAVVGDVSGHGPDEAALGVCLRIAWRTLVLCGAEQENILPVLDRVLVSERQTAYAFATVCMVKIAADRSTVECSLAGHPAPIRIDADGVTQAHGHPRGPALGFAREPDWPTADLALRDEWTLLLHTDGLFEAHDRARRTRLGEDGLVALIAERVPTRPTPASWAPELLDAVEARNGGPLADDAALVVLSHVRQTR